MKILFASAEVAPFAKVGGLADVAGSLPKAIDNLKQDICVMMPAYGSIDYENYDIIDVEDSNIVLELGNRQIPVSLKQGVLPDSEVIIYFIDNEQYFSSINEVYPKDCDHTFEQERFVVFSKAVLEFAKLIDFKPEVIHCNDWHTASIPVFLKTQYKNDSFYKQTSTIFSIHNLAYQGRTHYGILKFANLTTYDVFNIDGLEFNGGVNWMKGAICYSDLVNTVSDTYVKEIQTPEYGEELEGLLKHVDNKLSGVLNGIDYSVWNPETDKKLAKTYSIRNLKGKDKCKKVLQKEYALPVNSEVPLIGLVSRLVDQKGLDLIAGIADELKKMNLQFVVLGSGDERYENLFKELSENTENIKAAIGYNAQLAERIYAGCDMFLMPSRFEPCGLGQLISLKYGTIPIVRKTGGLADTVLDYDCQASGDEQPNGFVFEDYDAQELLKTIERATYIYKDVEEWDNLVKSAMSYDYSWNNSAVKYLELYIKAGL